MAIACIGRYGAAILIFASVASSQVAAQTSHSAKLNGRLLDAGVDTLFVTVEQPGRVVPVAVAVQSLRRVKKNGVDAWEQTYQWHGTRGDSTADTLWYALSNLTPIENHRHNGIEDAVTEFHTSSAHTVSIARSGTRAVSDTSIAGPLYASGEFESIIRASPLSQGYRARYNLYYGGRSIRSGPFEVVRSERVTRRDGQNVECWVVDAELSEGLNRFWIDKKTRKLVKLENHEDPTAAFVFRR